MILAPVAGFPLLLLGILEVSGASSFYSRTVLASFTLSSLFFVFLKNTLETVNRFKKWRVASLLTAIYCVTVPLLCCGLPLFFFVTNHELDYAFFKLVFLYLVIPFLTAITLVWFLVHFKVFTDDQLSSRLARFIRERRSVYTRVSNFCSIFMLSAMVTCETVLYLLFYNKLSSEESSDLLYLYGILLIIIPAFTLIGMLWSAGGLREENKLFYGSLFLGVGPLPVTIPLYISNEDYEAVTAFLLFFPLLSGVYWGTMSLLWSRNVFMYRITTGLGCVLLVIPIGIGVPVYLAGGMNSEVALGLGIAFLSIVGVLFLCLIGVLSYRFLRLPKLEKKKALQGVNCYTCAQWVSMICFLGGISMLVWVYSEGSEFDWASGLLIGMIIASPFVYLTSTVLIRTELSDSGSDFFADSEYQSRLQKIRRKRKLRLFTYSLGVVGFLLIIIGTGSSQSVDAEAVTAVLSNGTCFLLLAALVFVLTKLKEALQKYGTLITSLSMSCCWCFLFIPFFVLLPCTLALYTEGDALTNIISTSIGFAMFLFIGGVSVISIIFNVVLKKMEEEKKARYAVEKLEKELSDNGIKGDPRLLRVMYDQFILLEYQQFKAELICAAVFDWFPINEENQIHSKMIVTVEMKDKLMKAQKEQKPEETQTSVWELLGCFGISEKEQIVRRERRKSLAKRRVTNYMKPYQEETTALENIGNKVIPKDLYERITNREECVSIANDEDVLKKYYSAVFHFFARGDRSKGVIWMNSNDLRHFMRLTGVLRFTYNSESGVDTLYLQMTHYKANSSSMMTEDVFMNSVLPTLSKMKYPRQDRRTRIVNFFRFHVYPNLYHNVKTVFGRDGFKRIQVIQASHEDFDNQIRTNFHEKSNISELSFVTNLAENSDYSASREECCLSFTVALAKNCDFLLDKITSAFIKCGRNIGNTFQSLVEVPEAQKPPENEEIKFDESPIKKESPEWPAIVQICMSVLEESTQVGHLQATHFRVECNSTNIIFLIGRLTEYFSLASIAFREEIDWGAMEQGSQGASNVALVELNTLRTPFWIAFGTSLVYLALAIPAIKSAHKGMLGKNQDGTVAGFFTFSYWLIRVVTFLGSVLYMVIIKSLLNIFSCDMDDDPWMVRGSDMECFQDEHVLYLVFGTLALFIYYPIATFLYPTLQYDAEGTDFKFSSTYLVIVSQCKLLVTALATFFPYEEYIHAQLIISAILLFAVSCYSYYSEPCIVKKFNLWNTLGYVIGLWAVLVALFNVYTGEVDASVYLLWIGIALLTIVTAIIHSVQSRKKARVNVITEI